MTTHDHLSNNDIAFIAEMRSINIEWKAIALALKINEDSLIGIFHCRMNEGFKK